MTIQVTCDNCGKVVKAKDEYAGKKGKCPGCGHIVLMPAQKIVHAEADQSQFPWQNESVPAQKIVHAEADQSQFPWQNESVPAQNSRVNELPSTPATTNPNLRACSDCGRTVSKRAKQCPDCGAPLDTSETECRLTIGRARRRNGAIYSMEIKIDGAAAYSLKQEQKETRTLAPGKHKLYAKLGPGILAIWAEMQFTIQDGQHLQIEADPEGGMLGNKMVFNEVVIQ